MCGAEGGHACSVRLSVRGPVARGEGSYRGARANLEPTGEQKPRFKRGHSSVCEESGDRRVTANANAQPLPPIPALASRPHTGIPRSLPLQADVYSFNFYEKPSVLYLTSDHYVLRLFVVVNFFVEIHTTNN